MNKLEVKPTVENLINMLKQDAIERNEYIRMFLEMLDNIDDSFSISINGDWGTGKTFFVKQIYTLLTYYNQYIKEELNEYSEQLEEILKKEPFNDLSLAQNYVPIYYNAWNNDSHNDPVNSIIFNIIKEHNILKSYQKESSDTLDKIAKIIDTVNFVTNGIEILYYGILRYMDQNPEGEVTTDSFKQQLFGMYNVIFNFGDDHKEYSNNEIELNRYSYKYMMDALSLLKKGLKC